MQTLRTALRPRQSQGSPLESRGGHSDLRLRGGSNSKSSRLGPGPCSPRLGLWDGQARGLIPRPCSGPEQDLGSVWAEPVAPLTPPTGLQPVLSEANPSDPRANQFPLRSPRPTGPWGGPAVKQGTSPARLAGCQQTLAPRAARTAAVLAWRVSRAGTGDSGQAARPPRPGSVLLSHGESKARGVRAPGRVHAPRWPQGTGPSWPRCAGLSLGGKEGTGGGGHRGVPTSQAFLQVTGCPQRLGG